MISQVLFSLLLLSAMLAVPARAHEGHIHPPSIGRSTHPYLQACIAPYLRIHKALAEGHVGDGVGQAAQELTKQAQAGVNQESEATGRAMLEEMAIGAQTIKAAANLASTRQGFGQVNRAMLPFFKMWVSHLAEHGLTLFYCADEKARASEDKIDFSTGWMQKGKDPKSPYGAPCPNLQVERGED